MCACVDSDADAWACMTGAAAVLPSDEWRIQQGISGRNTECRFQYVGRPIKSMRSSIALFESLDHCTGLAASVIDLYMQEMDMDGFIRNAWDRYLDTVHDQRCFSTDEKGKAEAVGVENTGGLWLMLVFGGVFSIMLARIDFPACTVGGYSEKHAASRNMQKRRRRGSDGSSICGNEMASVSEIVPSAVTEGLTRLENESAATREAHADAQRAARAAEQQLARVTEALLFLARTSSTTPQAPQPSPLELDHIPLWQPQTPQTQTGVEHSTTPQTVWSNQTSREHRIDGRRLAREEEWKPPAPQTAQLFHKHEHWTEVPRQHVRLCVSHVHVCVFRNSALSSCVPLTRVCARLALSKPIKFSPRLANLNRQVASALEQEIVNILHSTTRKGRTHSKTEYSPPPSPPNHVPPQPSSNRGSRTSAPSSRRTSSLEEDRPSSKRSSLNNRPSGPVDGSTGSGRHEGRGRQKEPGAGREMTSEMSRRASRDRNQFGSG